MRPELRDYQSKAIEDARAAFAGGAKRVVLVSPTGSGKTVIGTTIADLATDKGQNCIWLSHRRELTYQTAMRMSQDVSILMSGERWRPHKLTVASIHTIISRGHRPPADFLIFDECHHAAADQFGEVVKAYPNARVLGLTATPARGDGRPLGDIFDSIVMGPTMQELIDGGFLVPSKVITPPESIKHLARDPAEAWLEWANGRRGFIFLWRVDESKEVRDKLTAEGLRVEHIDGTTPKKVRDAHIGKFRRGEIDVLCNVDVLTEGFDCPQADVCMIARGVGHVSTWLQMVGRILRPDGKKDHGLILDLRGNVHRHGLPEDDREWTLEGKTAAKTSDLESISQCPKCGAVYRAKPECPECGHSTPPVVQEVKEEPLSEYKTGMRKASAGVKRSVYRSLVMQARVRGYKDGWAAYQFKERFGHWPQSI